MIVGGRTMLPLRAIIEGMGGDVDWDNDAKRVTLEYNDSTITLDIGSSVAYGEDEYGDVERILIDSPAFINNGRTFLPVRAIMEFFGAEVEWNSSTRTVDIYF